MKKIYAKTFISKSEEAIEKMDNGIGFAEEGIYELSILLQQLTKGVEKKLVESSTTLIGDYNEKLNRMLIQIQNMYSLKNDLLDELEKLKNNSSNKQTKSLPYKMTI